MINEMKIQTVEITVVRIYTLERAENIPSILNYLQHEAKIRGISVFVLLVALVKQMSIMILF